jgi:hypothetical protein
MSKAFIAVIMSMALAGCGGMPRMLTQQCKKNDERSCTIAVTATSSGAGCTVNVSNDVLEVVPGNHDPDLIWRLDTADFEFAAPGVVFGDVRQLKLKRSTATEVRWSDKNTDGKKYAYTVLVVKPDLASDHEYIKCTPLDPWIHNQ